MILIHHWVTCHKDMEKLEYETNTLGDADETGKHNDLEISKMLINYSCRIKV